MSKSKVIKVDPVAPNQEDIEFAATLLRDGELVAFPTETVYGIGANALDKTAIKKLYEVKKRPVGKPFTIHISDINMIKKMHCEISEQAEELIKNFWPGPLTLILKSGKDKVGFRMPKNTVAKILIAKSGVPVAMPSANISGEKPPASASEVLGSFDGKIDLIIDGGKTELGKESTVVDMTTSSYKILRKGAITENEINRALNGGT